jgi:hypothetical protein
MAVILATRRMCMIQTPVFVAFGSPAYEKNVCVCLNAVERAGSQGSAHHVAQVSHCSDPDCLREDAETFFSFGSLSASRSPTRSRRAAHPGIPGSASHASRLVAALDRIIPAAISLQEVDGEVLHELGKDGFRCRPKRRVYRRCRAGHRIRDRASLTANRLNSSG